MSIVASVRRRLSARRFWCHAFAQVRAHLVDGPTLRSRHSARLAHDHAHQPRADQQQGGGLRCWGSGRAEGERHHTRLVQDAAVLETAKDCYLSRSSTGNVEIEYPPVPQRTGLPISIPQ